MGHRTCQRSLSLWDMWAQEACDHVNGGMVTQTDGAREKEKEWERKCGRESKRGREWGGLKVRGELRGGRQNSSALQDFHL